MHQLMALHGWRRTVTLAAALLLALVTGLARAAEPIAIVTNADHAGVPLDRSLLRSLFMARVRQWPDGSTAHVFVMPDASEVHDQFCREQLGTYPYVLRSAWDRIVFTGTSLAPTTVNSQEEMLERVRSTPGAIGYYRRPSDPSNPFVSP